MYIYAFLGVSRALDLLVYFLHSSYYHRPTPLFGYILLSSPLFFTFFISNVTCLIPFVTLLD